MSAPKAPAEVQLEQLDEAFGPGYFEHGRLIFTVARDIPGMMKVAHKLQQKTHEKLGSMVEIILEHVKHELWQKLHETTTSCSLQKGHEVAEYQVTEIPDGIRQHPYRRDRLPTLEVLLLWEDPFNGAVRGRCLFTMPHPEVPKLEEVDEIFAEIEPFFAKRWLKVQLALDAPQQGDFAETPELTGLCLSGAEVMVLACHPRGFASEASDSVVHVSKCQPLTFKAKSDDTGQAQICFLPAALNKVQVAETAGFYGTEVSLMGADMKSLDEGVTTLTVRLLPKAQASLSVHVFRMPKKMPEATEEMFGIIDWAAEGREAMPQATVEVTPLETNGKQLDVAHTVEDSFETEGLAEGCFSVKVACDGFENEERTLMLLVGPNHVYFPMVPKSD